MKSRLDLLQKSFFTYVVLFFLASCTMHPRYERPVMDTPEDWRVSLLSENGLDLDWWQKFEDPVLNDLIQEALVSNQDLKTAIARVDQFRAQLTIARSQFYPQLSTDVLSQRQKISSSVTALPTGIKPVFNLFGLVLNASYLVDLWGEVRSGAEAAYHSWLSSVEARRVVVLGLVSSVASSYIQLRQLDQQLKVSQNTLKDRQESCYLAVVRFDLGLTSDMEVEQAISEVEDAKLQVESFSLQIAEVENEMSVLLGKPSTAILRGKSLEEEKLPPSIPSFLPSDLLETRPDIRAAEERLIALNANIGVAKAKFFPKINFASAIGAESVKMNQLFTDLSKVWSFGSDIVQQIFTGFALTGGLDEAKAEREEALHSYLSSILKAFQEVNDALISHKIYLQELETQKAKVASLKNYLYLSNLRYKEGQIDYLTYLDAERHLFEALLDYETTKGNTFLSYIQIYQALGGGWVEKADEEALHGNNF